MQKSLQKSILFFIPFLLMSCFDIDYQINVNKDLSGTTKTVVKMSKMILAMAQAQEGETNQNTNLSKEKLMESETATYKLLDYKQTEDDEFIYYNFSYSFKNIAELNVVNKEMVLYEEVDGKKYLSFTHGLAKPNEEMSNVDESTKQMYESMFSGYFFKVSLQSQTGIKSAYLDDKKLPVEKNTVSHSFELKELMTSSKPNIIKIAF